MKIKIILLLFLIVVNSNITYADSLDPPEDKSYDIYYSVIYNYIENSNPELAEEWKHYLTYAIISQSVANNVQPLLVAATIKQESNFTLTAQSSAGAYGLMQLMPDTAKALGVNPYLPEENLFGGIKYLARQIENFSYAGEYSTAYALAAYNAGPNAVKKYGGVPPYSETVNYVNNIFNNYQYLINQYYYLGG